MVHGVSDSKDYHTIFCSVYHSPMVAVVAAAAASKHSGASTPKALTQLHPDHVTRACEYSRAV